MPLRSLKVDTIHKYRGRYICVADFCKHPDGSMGVDVNYVDKRTGDLLGPPFIVKWNEIEIVPQITQVRAILDAVNLDDTMTA